MVVRSDWRTAPSAVERSAASTTAMIATAAEAVQCQLELVLGESVGELNAEQRRCLDIAVRYGDRLVWLVEAMRTIALAQADELETASGPVDLVEVARVAVEGVWPISRVERKPIELRHEGEVWVDADGERLGRALLGLLGDAVEAARSGSAVTVSVSTEGVEVAYKGRELPHEGSLALADAIAHVHGGELTVSVDDGCVCVYLQLEAVAAVAA
jgi:signal transduction histidine kinase